MAKYRVIEGFYDLQDPEGQSYHLYDKGAEYPREGLEPTEERITFLLSASNKMSKPVIEEVLETAQEPAGEPAEEIADNPAEEVEKPAEEPVEAPKRHRKRG
jgi:hypothetical protein